MSHEAVLAATRHWLEAAVIGLNLCPFAKAVHQRRQIRWIVSDAVDTAQLCSELREAMQHLAATASVETTLVIHPGVLRDFGDYNDFLDEADALLEDERLDGVLQIASFHPQYRFADSTADDVADCSNRSPYPMLQLLREASIARAVAAPADAERIYGRNIETLRALGWQGWRRLMSTPWDDDRRPWEQVERR